MEDVATAQGTTLAQNARLFALVTMALNDGLMTSFTSKFHYGLWRPVHAIQLADQDGNPDTEADPKWLQLHAGTPPYPTYAGNAATIGASAATMLELFFGTDEIPFTIHWAAGDRDYDGFWHAGQEEADSRIYGGIHFRVDSEAGQFIGRGVSNYIFENYLLPLSGPVPGSGGGSGWNLGTDSAEIAAVRVLVGPGISLPLATDVEGGAGRTLNVPAVGRTGEVGIPTVEANADPVVVESLLAPRRAHDSSLDLVFSTSEMWGERF